jgi:biopolymer transport protein TolR
MAMSLGPRGRGRRAPPMSEINVTPLVDVMLVLLIIFMVTAPLLVAGVQVDLPDAKSPSLSQDQEPVQLSIDGDRRIFIGEEEVPLEALTSRMQALAQVGGEAPRLYVRADRTLDYGLVMRVVGDAHAAGLTKVALVSTGEGAAPAPQDGEAGER